MEIISYIDEQPVKNRKSYFTNTKGSLALKDTETNQGSSVSFSTIESNSYGAGRVMKDRSFKSFILGTRKGLNSFETMLGRNIKSILML